MFVCIFIACCQDVYGCVMCCSYCCYAVHCTLVASPCRRVYVYTYVYMYVYFRSAHGKLRAKLDSGESLSKLSENNGNSLSAAQDSLSGSSGQSLRKLRTVSQEAQDSLSVSSPQKTMVSLLTQESYKTYACTRTIPLSHTQTESRSDIYKNTILCVCMCVCVI